jgi:hypothetical protein
VFGDPSGAGWFGGPSDRSCVASLGGLRVGPLLPLMFRASRALGSVLVGVPCGGPLEPWSLCLSSPWLSRVPRILRCAGLPGLRLWGIPLIHRARGFFGTLLTGNDSGSRCSG